MMKLLTPCLSLLLLLLLFAPVYAASDAAIEYEPLADFSAEGMMIAQAPGEEEQLTFDSVFDWNPRVDDSCITWVQYSGEGKVWYYDTVSGNRNMVSNTPGDQSDPDLSGGIIVWSDSRNGFSDIYSYNVQMRKEEVVYRSSANKFKPAISGDYVVFEDFGTDDIRDIGLMKLGSTAAPTYINPGAQDKANPDIDGDWVVYQQLDDGKEDWNIYLYNLQTRETVQVTRDASTQQNPRINGESVVWEDNRNGKWDIFMYNIKKDMTTAVTFDDVDDKEPAISGSIIVWTRYGQDETSDIYMINLQIPKTYTVCAGPGNQVNPDISVDKVVWQDDRFGGWDILMYTLQPDTPFRPYQFYGPATVNRLPASVGTEILAKIGGVTKDSITVTQEGYYGGAGSMADQLTVEVNQADIGKYITFWSNGIQGTPSVQINGDGALTEQAIDFTYAAPLPDLEFYGSVFIDGQPAVKGTVLTAKIDDVARGTCTVTQNGQYGGQGTIDPALKIPITELDLGKRVTFWDGDYMAAESFQITCGGRFRQDLTVVTIPVSSPYEFYGYIMAGGKAAPAGTSIVAKIDDLVATTYTTKYAGSYGGPGINPEDPRLIVQVKEEDTGKTITFWSGSQRASATQVISRSGERIIRKDLDFSTSPSPGINADFSASPRSGNSPLTVQFTDLSTGTPTMWAWDFGDGVIPMDANASCSGDGCGMVANPVHTYREPGTYTVTLTASNQYGQGDTEIKQGYITVGSTSGLSADFSASPRSGNSPLTVQFTDLSTGTPTMWAWDFGDGAVPMDANASCSGAGCGMVANPVHTYREPGTYTVTLTASNQYGQSDTEIKQGYITVGSSSGFNADFVASPTSGQAPLTVQFTDLTAGTPTMWSWQFGDGTSEGMLASPKHTYTQAGTYTVTLTASNQYGQSDTESKTNYITVSSGPAPTDSIPVYPGWNFISVPKKLAPGSDTATIFANIDVDGHSIFQFDSLSGQWKTMNPASPVKPLEAVWIYSRKADQVPLTFDTDPLQTPPTRDLRKGWNGIGFTGLQPLEAKFTFLSIQDKWVNCLGYNEEKQQYDQMIIKGRDDTTLLYPYNGYWVFMSEDGTIAAVSA